uniref:G_PROTEIN_RECEP_F1_2 domain-containing protein n=1 Tax=Macrostomum lignano TaxID=282301 RepID=A0A1I8IWJ4_9PLAT
LNWTFCTCCFAGQSYTIEFLRFAKRQTLQFCIIKPVMAFVTIVLQAVAIIGTKFQNTGSPNSGYLYVTLIYNVSVAVALYGLLIFYFATRDLLSPFGPVLKFCTVKSVIFLSFWQSVLLAVLEKAGTIPAIYSQSGRMSTGTGTVAAGYQNFLICLEMLIAGVALRFAFPASTYSGDEESAGFVSGGGGSGAKRVVSLQSISSSLKETINPRDMVHDAIHNFHPQYQQYVQHTNRRPSDPDDGGGATATAGASSNSSSKYGTADSSADQASRPTVSGASSDRPILAVASRKSATVAAIIRHADIKAIMLAHFASVEECVNLSLMAAGGGGGGGGDSNSAIVYLWITCILGYVNTFTNGFSLIIFILDRKNIIMRRLLLLLSLSETVLNICLASNFTVMLWVGNRQRLFQLPDSANFITGAFFLSFMLFNAFIMIRNWCLVMIAGSRCEVVRNPLSTRSGQLFSPNRTLGGYILLTVISLALCSPRMFEFTWTVFPKPCNATGNETSTYLLTIMTHQRLDNLYEYKHYKTLLLFPMQTIAPIFLISFLSFLIIFTLRRRQFNQQPGSLGGGGAARSQDAATKTVMVLLICFVVFELPTFVFFVLNNTAFKKLANSRTVKLHTTFIANILVCVDSFSNFIVYSSTSNTFRDTVRRLLGLPGRKGAGVGGPNSGNYTLIRTVNPGANLRMSWSAAHANSVAVSHCAAARPGGGGARGSRDTAPLPLPSAHSMSAALPSSPSKSQEEIDAGFLR